MVRVTQSTILSRVHHWFAQFSLVKCKVTHVLLHFSEVYIWLASFVRICAYRVPHPAGMPVVMFGSTMVRSYNSYSYSGINLVIPSILSLRHVSRMGTCRVTHLAGISMFGSEMVRSYSFWWLTYLVLSV